jgi:WD40 repeat protein
MKKLVTILLFLLILSSFEAVLGEESSDPVIWKYKTNSWIISTNVTSDSSYTAASDLGGSIYFFDKTGKLLWSNNVGHRIVSLAISEDQSKVTAVTGEKIYFFNNSGNHLLEYKTVQGSFMKITQDGKYVGGSSSNSYAMFYTEGKPSWDYRTGDKVNNVALTPDGQTLAVASSDNNIYLLKSGFLLWKYDVKAPVISVEVTPDGSYVVCGTGSFESKEGETANDFKVYLFDGAGKLLWSETIGYTVSSVSITPDGSYVAVGSWDKKTHIFSKSGEHLREFKTEGNVLSVSITPDGKNVVAGSTDTYVYSLDVESMANPEKSSSFGNPIYIAIPIILIIIAGAVIYTKKFKKK